MTFAFETIFNDRAAISVRSSSVNMYFLSGLDPIATMTSSKHDAARLIMSMWPLVIGSSENA